ncbi:hypothetical protein LZ578_00375 [Jeotgalibaca sp. MA1X17-3]|uniref:type I phosphomannose isomerase catalytic subunit n=1 Tax=Jeotgalibaca sp. MA1X17-3 TaxID=2908211 RepID=UPI001F1DF66F|nr:type I phosphomannose isomerase catalytic subunit [Jeotgalibaca sp. MA1X17-3]UJF15701.1 hypothetical protein LZ578_00375 [Jeotgalibaca sp. MA1X17-3]
MKILKFKDNRVRRNYTGGKGIDELKNRTPAKDSEQPEEWIASTVEANNKGLLEVEKEGISHVVHHQSFIEMIERDPISYLGSKHYEQYGLNLGFLIKLLDSSMRLHTQAHPTREFAKDFMNSDWGKFEAYYILKIRDSEKGYIRLGFQQAPTKEEWKEIIQSQDLEKMDQCFEEIPIQQGDIVYIPGGVPHAIGENVLMVEIMEPSDLVVRCEFEREGIVVPEGARFMGKDLDFCLDIFDYEEYSVEDVQQKFFLEKEKLLEESNFTVDRLVPASIARSFEVFSVKIKNKKTIQLDEKFYAGLCVEGAIKIVSDQEELEIQQGESFFISSMTSTIEVESLNNSYSELCVVSNVLTKE